MKNSLKDSIVVLFLAFFGVSTISALITWLERKIYATAITALSHNKKTWLAEVEATTLIAMAKSVSSEKEESN